jgi:dipeptidyl aminopeptidase/acylaminoacyl peptidase
MFHGTLDVIVPIYQSQWMRGKLNNLGVTNEYYEYLAGHGFDNTQNQDVVAKLITFFQTHISN